MKKGYSLLKLAAGLLMLAMLSPQLCHAAFTQILYLARYNKAPVFGTDTLGGVTYTTISYEDLMNSGAPGMPSLPVDYLKFSVPYNATNFTVTATPTSNQPHYIDHLLYPCQAPRMINDTTPAVITLPDSAAYYSGTTYPTQTAWVVDEGFLDGENHIVTVAVMPFHYVHTATSDLVAQKRMVSVKLKFDLSDTLAMYPIVRNDSLLREEGYRLTRSMVVNPNQVKTFAPSQITILQDSMGIAHGGIGGDGLNWVTPDDTIPNHPGLNPTLTDTTNISTQEMYERDVHYPYLIVTTNELQHSLRRLVALKRQKGYNVKIVTMDDVMADTLACIGDVVNGQVTYTDPAGILRQYLRNHYIYSGTRFVLFVGDSIPYRFTTMQMTAMENKYITLPSDFYYSELHSNWQSDRSDFNPELYVGRIIAKDKDQIVNYTEKLLRYELNPGRGDYNYLKRAFYSEGYDLINSGEIFQVSREMNVIFTESNVISESRDIDDKSKFPSGDDIIDSLNIRKFGFISLHHHGFPAGFITYGYRNGECKDYLRFLWAIDSIHMYPNMESYLNNDPSTRNGLNRINNKWFPSICYSTGCKTMPFDILPGYEMLTMNVGESFTTGKDYGGPAYIGNTRDGYTPNTGYLEASFGRKLRKGYYRIGIADALAKNDINTPSDIIGRNYESTNQNLLGDPEFEVWTDLPQEYSGITIKRGDNSVTISGIEAVGTIVAQSGNTKPPKIQVADSSSVTLTNTPSNCTIMLYKHNQIPYIVPMMLQNTTLKNSQYVIASDFTAGRSVDDGRTKGDVIINSGVEYEIEASGTVTLEDGFKVERGATFAVYPSCF